MKLTFATPLEKELYEACEALHEQLLRWIDKHDDDEPSRKM